VKPAGFGDPQSAQTFEERAEARRLEVQAEHEAAFRRAKTNRPRNGQPELNLEPSSEPEPTMSAKEAAPIVVIPLPTVPPLPDDTIVPANGDADNSEQIAANTNARNILKLLHEGDF
jgi:hypothetical protein